MGESPPSVREINLWRPGPDSNCHILVDLLRMLFRSAHKRAPLFVGRNAVDAQLMRLVNLRVASSWIKMP